MRFKLKKSPLELVTSRPLAEEVYLGRIDSDYKIKVGHHHKVVEKNQVFQITRVQKCSKFPHLYKDLWGVPIQIDECWP